MLRLICSAQNYGWGKVGPKSQVAQIHNLNNGGAIDPHKPYAELWCGTHPNGPSLLAAPPSALRSPGAEEVTLQAGLTEFPSWLGKRVLERWNGELPFLFKVLSVAQALSIQAHPDKQLAERLHRSQPDQYRDANHKPEIAVAISKFTGLCGFAPVAEVRQLLVDMPELRSAVGEAIAAEYLARTEYRSEDNGATSKASNGAFNGASNGANGTSSWAGGASGVNGVNWAVEQGEHSGGEATQRSALKALFTALMTADAGMVRKAVEALTARIRGDLAHGRVLSPKESLALRLEEQYPGDVGVLASFLLNLLVLAPGEAMYMGPNIPHAYIEGDCVECMAASDNVVRAGLTPKPRDTATLCEMLTYDQGPPNTLKGELLDAYTRRYSTPFEEFEVDCVRVPAGMDPSPEVKLADGGPAVILVFAGEGSSALEVFDGNSTTQETALLTAGQVYFLPATCKLAVRNMSESQELVLYRAGCSSLVL